MEQAKGMWRGVKGFTLVELMVVMAIIAVLSAIVVPTVTGVTTKSSTTAQGEDVNQVQTQTESFNSTDRTGKWPTLADIAATPAWSAGSLPSTSSYAGLDWSAVSTDSDGATKTFYPDYVKKQPRHYDETATDSIKRWRLDSNGIVSVVMDGRKY